MCNKVYAVIVTIIAIILAVCAATLATHQGGLHHIVMMHRFFDVVIPILAIGALLKYLFKSCCHSHKK